MNALVDFVADNHVWWGKQPREKLAAHLRWFAGRDLLAASVIDGEVFAVCTVRFFRRLGDWLVPWVFEPDGAFCFIDLLVSASPVAQADCFEQLVKRWGSRPVVLWERGKRTEDGKAPRMFKWDQFVKLTHRMTYGIVTGE